MISSRRTHKLFDEYCMLSSPGFAAWFFKRAASFPQYTDRLILSSLMQELGTLTRPRVACISNLAIWPWAPRARCWQAVGRTHGPGCKKKPSLAASLQPAYADVTCNRTSRHSKIAKVGKLLIKRQ